MTQKTVVMNSLWLFLVASHSVVISSAAFADNVQPVVYPSDTHMADLELHIRDEAREKCRGEQSASYCVDRIKMNLEKEYPLRGTQQYARQYYAVLNDKELWKLQKTLADQMKAARSRREFYVDNPKPPGELTKEMLSNELHWVDQEIDMRDRQARAGPGGGLRGLARDLEKLGSH